MLGREFDLTAQAAIPPKCEGCGIQCELRSRLAGLLMAKGVIEQTGEGLVGDAGECFDAMLESSFPEEVADDIEQRVRQSVGRDLEEIDQDIAETRQEIDSSALSCSGVLKMRATKGDITYTVSVCTSPKVYVRDGDPQHLPAHIQASSVNKAG